MGSRIGLLMVGHVDPKSVHIAGDYPELFAALLAGHDIDLVRYDVDLGRFPESVDECDGWVCGPSRAKAASSRFATKRASQSASAPSARGTRTPPASPPFPRGQQRSGLSTS